MSEITKELNLNEKIALVSGTDFMFTNPIPRFDVPSVEMSDGPHGLRKQTEERDIGMADSAPSTAFPTSGTTANGWSRMNLNRVGEAIATECLALDVNVLLGPGINIKRNPLCGRNFEYFSEDPFLTAEMGMSFVNGVQNKNVGVSLKHFALNNSENFRAVGNSVCDERTMREIYLKPFEKIIKNCRPHTVMCAYNKINGTYCSENKQLLDEILRKEWGYQGAVVTDWGAMHDRVKALEAGVDVEMPGDAPVSRKRIKKAIEKGELDEKVLDTSVQRVLDLAKRYKNNDKVSAEFSAHHDLAGVIAQESAVLMKNDGTLPLKGDEKICVVGDLFTKMRYQGAGSSMINATKVTTPKDAFDKYGVEYSFARGYAENSSEIDVDLTVEAIDTAKDCDVILVFAGLTDYVEFEGCDREHMRLTDNQLALIDRLATLDKKMVVVLYGGSVVELPFADNVNALLNMFLPGQNGGTATYNLLFGKANPCGRLAQTWMKKYEDVPFGEEFSKTDTEVYKEGLFVGYRYYTSANVKTAFPFGYGLSYTTFSYSDVVYVRRNENCIYVSCNVVNSGLQKGKETVQVYVSKPNSAFIRPKRELKGFRQVNLAPGESRRVEVCIKTEDLAVYDKKNGRWVLEDGDYLFEICSSSEDVKAAETVSINGEKSEREFDGEVFDIYSSASLDKVSDEIYTQMSGIVSEQKNKTKKITMESRFSDFRKTYWGRVIYKEVMKRLDEDYRKALALEDSEQKDKRVKSALFTNIVINNSSIIQMTMSKSSILPYNYARALVSLANGNIFGAVYHFFAKVKGTPLPKDEK